jgi:hypothetical protein
MGADTIADDEDARDFLLQSYAFCVFLLYLLYFYTQMSAADPNAHPAEDAAMVGKNIEAVNSADEAGKAMVNWLFDSVMFLLR